MQTRSNFSWKVILKLIGLLIYAIIPVFFMLLAWGHLTANDHFPGTPILGRIFLIIGTLFTLHWLFHAVRFLRRLARRAQAEAVEKD